LDLVLTVKIQTQIFTQCLNLFCIINILGCRRLQTVYIPQTKFCTDNSQGQSATH